jgi:hypothetical protein
VQTRSSGRYVSGLHDITRLLISCVVVVSSVVETALRREGVVWCLISCLLHCTHRLATFCPAGIYRSSSPQGHYHNEGTSSVLPVAQYSVRISRVQACTEFGIKNYDLFGLSVRFDTTDFWLYTDQPLNAQHVTPSLPVQLKMRFLR